MRLLLMDTCGEVGSLALAENGVVLRVRALPPRTASSQLIGDIRAELESLGLSLNSLGGVGVVNGPGSFTGVRVGLAAAKGLCEVSGVSLVAVSRLEVLLAAGSAVPGDLAVLDAGRGEFYVRAAADGEELLLGQDELLELTGTGRLLVAEEKLLVALDGQRITFVELTAAHALPLAERGLGQGGVPVDSTDANYVRQARGLYASGPDKTGPHAVCSVEIR